MSIEPGPQAMPGKRVKILESRIKKFKTPEKEARY
jgi:hypothetical protein